VGGKNNLASYEMKALATTPCVGYIEGYYGRLPSWAMRTELLEQLHHHGMSSYFYAPKEDPQHRLHWREPYSEHWRDDFKRWCAVAQKLSINTIAGIAPGLDFNFKHVNGGEDLAALVDKAQQFLDDGATSIALLMDDINRQFNAIDNNVQFEGQAHAMLANVLSEQIGCAIYVVPRVYAKELKHESVDYAQHFVQNLNNRHVIFHCGTHIVSQSTESNHFNDYAQAGHRIVVWDNLYANDYCPRRLFVGPWTGRSQMKEIMLNPTGMPATDALLLDIMAFTFNSDDADLAHRQALDKHVVPEQFLAVARYFSHPPFGDIPNNQKNHPVATDKLLDALEFLLWKWKTPLSREWYPYLFGLKHDLHIASATLPQIRIRKTQLEPLASALIKS